MLIQIPPCAVSVLRCCTCPLPVHACQSSEATDAAGTIVKPGMVWEEQAHWSASKMISKRSETKGFGDWGKC